MVGPRLFRSRWSALFWAGGVLWTAYDVANATADRPDDAAAGNAAAAQASPAAIDANTLAILANAD